MAVELRYFEERGFVGSVNQMSASELEARIAEIYRERIADANLILNVGERVETLSNIARDLLQCGDLDTAIQDAQDFGMTLSDISQVLKRNGYDDKAISINNKKISEDDEISDLVAAFLRSRGHV